jgi:hypothetical protein
MVRGGQLTTNQSLNQILSKESKVFTKNTRSGKERNQDYKTSEIICNAMPSDELVGISGSAQVNFAQI